MIWKDSQYALKIIKLQVLYETLISKTDVLGFEGEN